MVVGLKQMGGNMAQSLEAPLGTFCVQGKTAKQRDSTGNCCLGWGPKRAAGTGTLICGSFASRSRKSRRCLACFWRTRSIRPALPVPRLSHRWKLIQFIHLLQGGSSLLLAHECQENVGSVTKWPGIILDPPSVVAEQLPLARQDGTGLRPQLSLWHSYRAIPHSGGHAHSPGSEEGRPVQPLRQPMWQCVLRALK